MESQYPVKHKKLHCPSYPIVPWTRWTVQWIPSASLTYKIPLSILSYCTMDKMDDTMESQYPVKHKKLHCPSYPIVPWTRWTVQWIPSASLTYKIPLSILSYCTMDKMDDTMESQYPVKHKKLHCPSYPIVPWTRWTVQWIPSASQTYKTPLSMLSYCTMDRMDGINIHMKSHRPSHPIVPWTGWTVQ